MFNQLLIVLPQILTQKIARRQRGGLSITCCNFIFAFSFDEPTFQPQIVNSKPWKVHRNTVFASVKYSIHPISFQKIAEQ